MIDPKAYSFCNEFYVVEKSVEAVAKIGGEDRRVRIDALAAATSEGRHHSTAVYIMEDITVQPTYPQQGDSFVSEPRSVSVWVRWIDFPWTARETADDVIVQALGFLSERAG